MIRSSRLEAQARKRMKNITGEILFGIFLILIMVFFTGARTCGKYWGREEVREEAIKAGVATYECNRDTGKCIFTWKTKP